MDNYHIMFPCPVKTVFPVSPYIFNILYNHFAIFPFCHFAIFPYTIAPLNYFVDFIYDIIHNYSGKIPK